MTVEVEATRAEHADATVAPGGSVSRRRRRWLLPLLLVGGWLLATAWRIWLARHAGMPFAHTDEDSYLNTARALAGGPGGFSSENETLRRIGYPLLIAPAFLLDREFLDTYLLVRVINAALNATILPLAYLLGRRLLGLRSGAALAAAVGAVTLPAVAFHPTVAMTDAVFGPLLLAWLLAVHRLVDRPGPVAAAVCGALAGAAHLVHSRGVVIVAGFALLVLALLVRRRLDPAVLLAAVLPVAVAALGNEAGVRLLGDTVRLLGEPAGGNAVRALTSVRGLSQVLASVGTQLWYLTVVTFGLAGLAGAEAVTRVCRRSGAAARWTFGMALLTTVGVAVGAEVVLAGVPDRVPDAIYARYVQVFAPFWMLVGVGLLFGTAYRPLLRRLGVTVLLLAAGGALIRLRLDHAEAEGARLRWGGFSAPDLMALTDGWRQMRPLVGAAIGIAGCLLLVLVLAIRRPAARTSLLAVVLAALVVLNVATMQVIAQRLIRPLATAGTPVPSVTGLGVRAPDRVAASTGVPYQLRFNLSHQVTWTEVPWFRDRPPADAEVVFARWAPGEPGDWDGARYGFVRLGGDPQRKWAGWRRR
ncbi:glycosyltransferase family 39 protein [Verrucosispora sp. WMMA2121]|uniref:glycosyltransferase family 39 protein n=1 Tax=Verrucosispora sp. WMMA2121 TaxID=3015164 RepID=UPI0022B66880|nr:glycosyltransferase family 39 protein [Verrucosispora sp. WMMA2121]MCZ7419936.1 glycosyltransferase family 39 protein [Verrucosispora sp. WMMA2121]